MLEGNNTLTSLNLQWNSIRLASAETLAAALQFNKSLKILKLGNNSFGEVAIELLGKSLKYNRSIVHLDISYNALNPKAMSVLSNSLIYNHTLRELNISGNVLGAVGAQAFVAAVQRAAGEHRKLAVSFDNCDCEKIDAGVFDPSNPTGTWVVDLSTPYGQMVAEECIFLANHKSGCNIVKLEYEPPKGKRYTVNLVRSEMKRNNKFTEFEFRAKSRLFNQTLIEARVNEEKLNEAAKILLVLLQMFSFDIQIVLAQQATKRIYDNWFTRVDQGQYHEEDLSDQIMYEMFIALFQCADEDGSGFVSYSELDAIFLLLGLKLNEKETKRLRQEFDIDGSGQVDVDEFSNAMVQEFCNTEIPKGDLVEKSSGQAWVIPEVGRMIVEIMYKTAKPGIFNVMRNDMMMATIDQLRGAKNHEQRYVIFKHSTNSPYYFMSAYQAQLLFDEMNPGTDAALDLMMEILPQIVDEINSMKFIDANLSLIGKLALRMKIGPIYNAYVGNPTGHYTFDLKNRLQRNAACKLSTISVSEAYFCELKGINTSQKGYYSSFRNETLGGALPSEADAVKATGEWFARCPISGKLRCDFVSTNRPRQGTRPMSDHRFKKLVRQQIDLDELYRVQKELNECTTQEASNEISARVLSNLPNFMTIVSLKTAFFEFVETSHHFYERVVYAPERMRDLSRPNYINTSRPTTPEDMKIGNAPKHDTYSPIFPLAYMKLILLQVQLPGNFFSVQQVIDMLFYFPETDYLRVQLLLIFFGRLTDLENLYRILDELFTIDERVEAYHRLGILNCIDPIRPDRFYRLDLRRWDHREMTKLLVKLASAEPGDNWEDPQYRWGKYDEAVPGWQLPAPWTLPDVLDERTGEVLNGPRNSGWMTLKYTSTGEGCVPSYAARRYLRNTRTLTGLVKLL